MKSMLLFLVSTPLLLLGSCSAAETPVDPMANLEAHLAELGAKSEHDAGKIEVHHILISFAGAGTTATRTKEEAEKLAAELLVRIQAGEDFGTLVGEYSDDRPPGIYIMSTGVVGPGEFARKGPGGMVPAFGDVGWKLGVGEVGVAAYAPGASPFGWHIIKRLS